MYKLCSGVLRLGSDFKQIALGREVESAPAGAGEYLDEDKVSQIMTKKPAYRDERYNACNYTKHLDIAGLIGIAPQNGELTTLARYSAEITSV